MKVTCACGAHEEKGEMKKKIKNGSAAIAFVFCLDSSALFTVTNFVSPKTFRSFALLLFGEGGKQGVVGRGHRLFDTGRGSSGRVFFAKEGE